MNNLNLKSLIVPFVALLTIWGITTAMAQTPAAQTHIVQPGETLFDIAQTYLGDGFRYPEIVTATQAKYKEDATFANIQNANLIEVGDKLLIPTNGITTTPTVQPTPTIATTTGASGKIAFSFWNNAPGRCTYEINIIDVSACLTSAEACQANRRIFRLSNASEPALSPDGQRLVYRGWGVIPDEYGEGRTHPYKDCAEPEAERWIQTSTLDATDVRQITGYWEDSHPDWSPDGSRILFDTRRLGDGLTRIMFMYADTTGEDPDGPHAEALRIAGEHPSWAPDNDRFVYRGCDVTGNRCGLWLARAIPVQAWDLGINLIGPVIQEPEVSHPDWSPVSEQIVYDSPINGNWDIYMINADGSGQQQLTTAPSVEGLPTWSPDGQWIAYLSNANGNWGIWIMRADGTGQQLLFAYDGGQYTLPAEVDPYGVRNWYDEQISWSK